MHKFVKNFEKISWKNEKDFKKTNKSEQIRRKCEKILKFPDKCKNFKEIETISKKKQKYKNLKIWKNCKMSRKHF